MKPDAERNAIILNPISLYDISSSAIKNLVFKKIFKNGGIKSCVEKQATKAIIK